MVKTLVTLCYHHQESEVEFGRDVRDYYLSEDLGADKDILFHEILNNPISGGEQSSITEKEVAEVIKREGIELWIDIHSGIKEEYGTKVAYVNYYSEDVEKVRNVFISCQAALDYSILDLTAPYTPKLVEFLKAGSLIHSIPRSVIETPLKSEDYASRNEQYEHAVSDTCKLINVIYYVHL